MGDRLPSQPEAVGQEFKSKERYQLPYSWGTLHVTHQADEAYGLRPLNTDPETLGQPMPHGDVINHIRTNIWLVGPDELADWPYDLELEDDASSISVRVESFLVEDGIGVVAGFGKAHKETVQAFASDVEAGIIEMGDDERPDALDQKVRIRMLHLLVHDINEAVSRASVDYLNKVANNSVFKSAKRDLVTGVGGAAVISSIGYTAEGRINPVIAGLSIFLLSVNGIKLYRDLKKYIEKTDQRRRVEGFFSVNYGSAVAGELHRTYCPDYFDHQIQQLLDQTPDDSDPRI